MSVGIIAGNVRSMTIMQATVDLGSVAANTSETETATVVGVKSGDIVIAEKPTLEAGLLIGSCWVSADDTVSIQVGNLTASPIDAASETWTFTVLRPETVYNYPSEVLK
jgi:hypothetical protein